MTFEHGVSPVQSREKSAISNDVSSCISCLRTQFGHIQCWGTAVAADTRRSACLTAEEKLSRLSSTLLLLLLLLTGDKLPRIIFKASGYAWTLQHTDTRNIFFGFLPMHMYKHLAIYLADRVWRGYFKTRNEGIRGHEEMK